MNGESIEFTVSHWGFLLAGGSSKGYAYCVTKPKDKDTRKPGVGGEDIEFRPIKGHWYIFEEDHD